MSRNPERRVTTVLRRRRLLFIEVGERVGLDRVISQWTERDGATVTNPEWIALVREIVKAARGPTP